MSLILRVVRVGFVAALLVALAGWSVGRARFGATDRDAVARIDRELQQRMRESADRLESMASRIAAAGDAVAPRDQTALKSLFELVGAALPDEEAGRTGITVYDAQAAPVAWAGRVSDLPRARIDGVDPLLVMPGALGPRLVRVRAVPAPTAPSARVATIVAEQALGTAAESTPGVADTFVIATSIAPVAITADASRPPSSDAAIYRVDIPLGTAGITVAAEIPAATIAEARARWHRGVRAAVVSVLALTLFACTGPLIERRRHARTVPAFLGATAAIAAVLLASRAVLWYAAAPLVEPRTIASPLDLLLTALTIGALAWLTIDVIERRRVSPPRPRLLSRSPAAVAGLAAAFMGVGLLGAWLLWVYERVINRIVSHTDVDLLHFSLHPVSPTRLALAFGLVVLDAAVIWTIAALIRVPTLAARTPRRPSWRLLLAAAWIAGALLGTTIAAPNADPAPLVPVWIALLAAAGCAVTLVRIGHRVRRASQAARLATFFLALLVPALAMYPSLFADVSEAKELLVSGEYAPQALRQREDLKLRLGHTLDQIDAIPGLNALVLRSARSAPAADRAFLVWSRTDLATYRLTSAIELYGEDGRMVTGGRFALSLPEYTTPLFFATSCSWEAFDEVAPFGSSTRHVLRASRGLCERGEPTGAIVVRAMLDYRTLPFISSQNPYLESLRPTRSAPAEGIFGRDVEFAVYGWSRAPIYASGTSVWTLPDEVFQHMAQSREPVWSTVTRDGERFRVYFCSDRGGIYALGYPVITWFGHFVTITELITLTGVLYIVLLIGGSLYNAVTSAAPASGHALLREVRSSFYRKLFLAFWAVAVVPVAILAIAAGTYLAAQLRAGVEDASARTVTVAQRLVEDYATLQQRGAGALTAIDDQIMVLVRRAIDEDVNLFDRDHLQATSARDLFASQLLPMRTPGGVYKTILLDRAPTFVGDEQVGELRYRLAAAPVRAGGREGIVTVPLTSRDLEIEQQIDELDRRVLSAAVLFSLLGAAIGYWMAERIADPVNRLTRATRRIARGDLDARIAATSSDELRRLVEDFNQMAEDLKRQRAELERTQRIEAWADMARQVAHDIKNPLTPIQLSAEHARRINLDRGRPLSPVLDECVAAILTQVKLLRQISAEFSSFASAPTPRPEPTSLPALIEEVVEGYRTGLAGRIAIEVHATSDLPAVVIDRTLFSRALTNVIENALHAMPGTGTLTISSRESTVDSRQSVIVEVTDTGVGMDAESAAKIFEPYFSTKATGTGLGLTIAKRNIELNGGTIDVRSERGVGTTVAITLPLG